MIRPGLVLNRTALIQIAVAPFMLTAIPFSVYYRTNDMPALLGAFGITLAASLGTYALTPRAGEVNHREGICIVTLAWILAAGFGALLHIISVHRVVAALAALYYAAAVLPWTRILFFG